MYIMKVEEEMDEDDWYNDYNSHGEEVRVLEDMIAGLEGQIDELEDHLVEEHGCFRPTVTESYKLRARAEVSPGDSQ